MNLAVPSSKIPWVLTACKGQRGTKKGLPVTAEAKKGREEGVGWDKKKKKMGMVRNAAEEKGMWDDKTSRKKTEKGQGTGG